MASLGTEPKPRSVLFLCVHNSGRSQMGAGWLRHLGGESVRVLSAGSDPGSELNAAAVEAMAEVGVDISTNRPQRWTPEMVEEMDVIISMGCGDTCPVARGQRYEEWELADPAGQGIEMVREVRDQIRDRVSDLVVSLGLPVLSEGADR